MIYFSSDHHFGHKNILKYCPNRQYSSIEEMDLDLINKWNNIIKQHDIVYYLGDFSLSKQAVREIFPKLNGEIHLIPGNHDWCHPVQYKKDKNKDKYEKVYLENGVKSIKLNSLIIIDNQEVLLSHLPYLGGGDRGEKERYSDFRLKNEDKWLLCGHIHNLWKVKDKMINVGVDQWDGFPVSIEEISKIIGEYKNQ